MTTICTPSLPVSNYLSIGVNVWIISRFSALRAFVLFRVSIPTPPLTLDTTLSVLQASTTGLVVIVNLTQHGLQYFNLNISYRTRY